MATPAPASALALTRLFSVHKQPNSHLKFLVPTKTTTLKTTIPLLCSATNKPPPSSLTTTQISSSARIRSEVLSPFRSVRMFFYLAFIASGGLGGLIATTRLISSLVNPNSTRDSIEIVKGLGIDVIAVSLFAFLYFRENNAKNAQLARLSREESLSNLKLRVDESRVINVSSLRGAARLVVVAGPTDFVKEAFERSKLFTDKLVERGVLVVPFVTDGGVVKFDFEEEGGEGEELEKRKKLWQFVPFSVSDWAMSFILRS